MNQKPTPAYIEMVKAKLDAMNSLNGFSKGSKKGIDEIGQFDHYAQFRNDDHFDMMGRAAIEYMKKRDQNFGHPNL